MEKKISELVRVTTIEDYVGQHSLKSRLNVKVEAALIEERLLDHTLFVGPAGAGKTTLAELIAKRLNDQLLVLPMPMPYNDFLYAVENFMGGIVFLDEIHNANRQFQEALQFGLQDGYLAGSYGAKVSTAHVTFIAATTTGDANRLLPALVQRFKYKPAWDPYTKEDIAEIMTGMARRANVDIPAEVCVGLAGAASGNPRVVQDLVAAARDLAAIGRPVTVEGVLELAERDCDGLTRDHLDYLRALHALQGQAGLSTLVSVTGMNSATLQDLERTLVMGGFVTRGGSGRKLMPTGRAKIDQAGGGEPLNVAARRRLSA